MPAQRRPVSPVETLRDHPHLGPTALARVLGRYLRETREVCGFSAKEVAAALRASVTKVSRMETAKSPLGVRDVALLLEMFGVPDEESVHVLALVEQSTRSEWFHPYAAALRHWVLPLLGLEGDAQVIRTFEPHFVPGLLQTEEYARAVAATSPILRDDATVEARVRVRRERQDRLLREGGPELWMLLDEAVLWRPVGGREVMRRQLEHVLRVMADGSVIVQVAGYEATAVVTPGGAATQLRFADRFLPDMLYLERSNDGVWLEDDAAVEDYRALLDQLSAIAKGRGFTFSGGDS